MRLHPKLKALPADMSKVADHLLRYRETTIRGRQPAEPLPMPGLLHPAEVLPPIRQEVRDPIALQALLQVVVITGVVQEQEAVAVAVAVVPIQEVPPEAVRAIRDPAAQETEAVVQVLHPAVRVVLQDHLRTHDVNIHK